MNESESEIEVSDNSDNYFNNGSDTETINSVTPDELVDNPASLEPLDVDFYAESLQKNCKTITSCKVYTTPVWNTLKEGEAI